MSSRSKIAVTLIASCVYVSSAYLTLSLIATKAAHAAGTESTPTTNAEDADFVVAKGSIKEKRWDSAITSLKSVVARDPKNADAHNLLGYSYRWKGMMDLSFKHYDEALKLEPNHKGANEYIGVAYLKVNKPEKAKEHLAKLEKICGKSCEEYEDLSKAIAAYKPLTK
jgi:Tfp pilus assembly protein PilF